MRSAGVEIEVKFGLPSSAAGLRQLRRLHARRIGKVHERNTLFDTPEGLVKYSGRLLRVRSLERMGRSGPPRRGRPYAFDGPAGLLTLKGPASGGRYKVRDEVEVQIGQPDAAERILLELGFRPWFRYEKYRTSFRLPGLPRLSVELDETPIGTFFELEGPGESIDRGATLLGFGPREYIVASYYDLFLPECRRLGLAPDAMLFPARS
jgi:adenylate cyclase class 2